MIGFEINIKHNNRLSAAAQRLVVPFAKLGQDIAQRIRLRAADGFDPENRPWTPLSTKSGGRAGRDKKNPNWFWVRPSDPQPTGYLFKVPETARTFAGYAVYHDYATFLANSDGGNRRDFYRTGELWASLRVRPQSANRIKLIFSGSRKVGGKTIQNRRIAQLAAKNERFGVLTYSDAERQVAVDFVKASIDEQMATRLQQVSQVDKLSARAARANARVTKSINRATRS